MAPAPRTALRLSVRAIMVTLAQIVKMILAMELIVEIRVRAQSITGEECASAQRDGPAAIASMTHVMGAQQSNIISY